MSNAVEIRILLVDDHPLVRDGLRARLEAAPRLRVVGEAGSGQEAIAQAGASLKLSKAPELQASGSLQTKSQESRLKDKFISVFDIANLLQDLSEELQLNRVFCLIDEWSEIPNSAQKHLAELAAGIPGVEQEHYREQIRRYAVEKETIRKEAERFETS